MDYSPEGHKESDMAKMSNFIWTVCQTVCGAEWRQNIDKTMAKFFQNFIKTTKL